MILRTFQGQRYRIIACTDWPIRRDAGRSAVGPHGPTTSYSVCDSIYNWREVGRFYAGEYLTYRDGRMHPARSSTCLRDAMALARRLNAEETEYLASEAG